ncbi:MAG TPA: 4'-phosphopantetheinyl transferase superfamily protein [Candidatus Limnocylindria bacterium]|jgi:phosphopantetheinyl transferase|nr:4'-phosphopantetheinyl transferase superfamily protein [Candidatus Limnocylindria bacterium]
MPALPHPVRTVRLDLGRPDGPWAAVLAAIPLTAFDAFQPEAGHWLGSEEKAYFQCLTHRRRQESFLLGRLAAKFAVSELVPTGAPAAIEIRRGVFDQPLVRGPGCAGCSVSISHDETWAVALAFQEAHPMAIDVETVTAGRILTIESQLLPQELGWAAAGPDREAICTLLWTAKEALSKVLGCGLTAPMRLLSLKEFGAVGPARWRGLFENFTQYQALGTASGRTVFSLVLPRNSVLQSPEVLSGFFSP